MKTTVRTAAAFLCACALAIVGCKKDEPTPTEILTADTCWKMTLLEGYDTVNKLWVSSPIEDCDADNCFTFKANQDFIAEEGATKCYPDDPQTAEGTWSLSTDGKKLSLTDAGDTSVGNVVELVEGKLVYELDFDNEKVRVTMKTN